RVVITAPIILKHNQGLIEKLLQLMSDGFMRVWVDHKALTIEEFLPTISMDTDAKSVEIV
ncbi:MAG: hypothetical protein IIV47_05215, partial [Clostridia bacterium]|nr:hypothetical protein [Clostridia bacterium]